MKIEMPIKYCDYEKEDISKQYSGYNFKGPRTAKERLENIYKHIKKHIDFCEVMNSYSLMIRKIKENPSKKGNDGFNMYSHFAIIFKDFIDWNEVIEDIGWEIDKFYTKGCRPIDHSLWYSCIKDEFLNDFGHKINKENWRCILLNQRKISEDILRKFANEDKIDFHGISYHHKLSESFIRDFSDRVDWFGIFKYQPHLSKDFFDEFKHKYDEELCRLTKKKKVQLTATS